MTTAIIISLPAIRAWRNHQEALRVEKEYLATVQNEAARANAAVEYERKAAKELEARRKQEALRVELEKAIAAVQMRIDEFLLNRKSIIDTPMKDVAGIKCKPNIANRSLTPEVEITWDFMFKLGHRDEFACDLLSIVSNAHGPWELVELNARRWDRFTHKDDFGILARTSGLN